MDRLDNLAGADIVLINQVGQGPGNFQNAVVDSG